MPSQEEVKQKIAKYKKLVGGESAKKDPKHLRKMASKLKKSRRRLGKLVRTAKRVEKQKKAAEGAAAAK